MIKLNEEFFKKIGKKIYIETDVQFINTLHQEFNNIYQKLEDLQKIDTINIEPLVRVGKPISILREDEIDSSMQLDKKSARTNATERNEDFIIIQRNKK